MNAEKFNMAVKFISSGQSLLIKGKGTIHTLHNAKGKKKKKMHVKDENRTDTKTQLLKRKFVY